MGLGGEGTAAAAVAAASLAFDTRGRLGLGGSLASSASSSAKEKRESCQQLLLEEGRKNEREGGMNLV